MTKFLRNSLIGGGLLIGLVIALRVINKKRSTFPLKLGSEGPEVENLQKFLIEMERYNWSEDNGNVKVNGKFDNGTLESLRMYQLSFDPRKSMGPLKYDAFLEKYPTETANEVSKSFYNRYIKKYKNE